MAACLVPFGTVSKVCSEKTRMTNQLSKTAPCVHVTNLRSPPSKLLQLADMERVAPPPPVPPVLPPSRIREEQRSNTALSAEDLRGFTAATSATRARCGDKTARLPLALSVKPEEAARRAAPERQEASPLTLASPTITELLIPPRPPAALKAWSSWRATREGEPGPFLDKTKCASVWRQSDPRREIGKPRVFESRR